MELDKSLPSIYIVQWQDVDNMGFDKGYGGVDVCKTYPEVVEILLSNVFQDTGYIYHEYCKEPYDSLEKLREYMLTPEMEQLIDNIEESFIHFNGNNSYRVTHINIRGLGWF